MIVKGRPTENPNTRDIIRYKDHLLKTKSPWTANSYLAAIRGYFYYLEKEKIFENIAKDIKPAKLPKGYRKLPLSKSDIKHMIHSINSDSFTGQRDQLLITLMYVCGLRSIEVARLNVSDLESPGNQAKLHIQGKGSRFKQPINISEELHYKLTDFLSFSLGACDVEGEDINNMPLFRSHWKTITGLPKRLTAKDISSIVDNRIKKAGLKTNKISPHSLRHSAAIHLLESTNDIFQVQTFLRHHSPTTTKLYLEHSEEAYSKRRQLETILSNNLLN